MSRSPDTLYFGPNQSIRTKPVNFLLDEERVLTIDLSAYCGIEGALIVAANWGALDNGEEVSIATPSTTTKTTSALVTAGDTGLGRIQVAVQMDNSEVILFVFRCHVTDPMYASAINDRYQ